MTLTFDSPHRSAVLVLGGRGFVGAHVTEALIRSGRRPHLFGPRMQDDLLAEWSGQFDETEGSIENTVALRDVLAQSGARDIISMAAFSAGRVGLMRSGEAEAEAAMAVNVAGFRRLCDVASAAQVRRLVWASSTVIYGGLDVYDRQPVSEADPAAPQTFYGLTKQLAEAAAAFYRHRHGLSVTGLRLPLVLGPKLWYAGAASAILDAARAAREGRAHQLEFHDDPMDLMHVRDTARAFVACLEHSGPLAGVYNINGFRARMSEVLAALAADRPGWRSMQTKVAATQDFPAISDARFRADLGFTPEYDLRAVTRALLTEETPQ